MLVFPDAVQQCTDLERAPALAPLREPGGEMQPEQADLRLLDRQLEERVTRTSWLVSTVAELPAGAGV